MTTYSEFIENLDKIQDVVSDIEHLVKPYCSDKAFCTRFFNYARNELLFNEVIVIPDDGEKADFNEAENRQGTFFFGNPVTNSDYPWPVTEKGLGLIPLVQIDLAELSRNTNEFINDELLENWLKKIELGEGEARYLQLWSDSINFTEEDATVIRLVPQVVPDLNEKATPKLIVNNDDWFNNSNLRVRFPFEQKILSRNGYELLNYYTEGLAVWAGYSNMGDIDVPIEVEDELERLEEKLRKWLPIDDIPMVARNYNGHFFGSYYPISGCFSPQEGLTTIDFIEYGDWRVLLQFPDKEHFQCLSRRYENEEDIESLVDNWDGSHPLLSGWDGSTPTVFYRFTDENTPEFMTYFYAGEQVGQAEYAEMKGDEVIHFTGATDILSHAIETGKKPLFDTEIHAKSFNVDEVEKLRTSLLEYCNKPNSSEKIAIYFLQKLGKYFQPRDFQCFCVDYFSNYHLARERGFENHIHKRLLNILNKLGIEVKNVTLALAMYIYRNGSEFNLKFFDTEYVTFLLENGADPNLVVEDIEYEYDFPCISPMASALWVAEFVPLYIAKTLLELLIKHGGELQSALEEEYLELDELEIQETDDVEIVLRKIRTYSGIDDTESSDEIADSIATENIELIENDIDLVTNAFTDKLKTMFSYLSEHGVYAVDVYNHGYDPKEGRDYAIQAISNQINNDEVVQTDIERFNFCWIDIQYAKEQVTHDPLGFGPMLKAVDSIYIYYDGETDKAKKHTTEMILEAAKSVGLGVEWNGDINKVILLKLT